jgi:hypothetical protein
MTPPDNAACATQHIPSTDRHLGCVLNCGIFFAEAPSPHDVADNLKSASGLPHALIPFGIVGVIVGLLAGAGLSSYFNDKGWGNPAAFGPLYWAVCCAGGAILTLVAYYGV